MKQESIKPTNDDRNVFTNIIHHVAATISQAWGQKWRIHCSIHITIILQFSENAILEQI